MLKITISLRSICYELQDVYAVMDVSKRRVY